MKKNSVRFIQLNSIQFFDTAFLYILHVSVFNIRWVMMEMKFDA